MWHSLGDRGKYNAFLKEKNSVAKGICHSTDNVQDTRVSFQVLTQHNTYATYVFIHTLWSIYVGLNVIVDVKHIMLSPSFVYASAKTV